MTPVVLTPSTKRKLPTDCSQGLSSKKRRSFKHSFAFEFLPSSIFNSSSTPASGTVPSLFPCFLNWLLVAFNLRVEPFVLARRSLRLTTEVFLSLLPRLGKLCMFMFIGDSCYMDWAKAKFFLVFCSMNLSYLQSWCPFIFFTPYVSLRLYSCFYLGAQIHEDCLCFQSFESCSLLSPKCLNSWSLLCEMLLL